MGFTAEEQKEFVDMHRKIVTDAPFRKEETRKCISSFYSVPGAIDKFALIMNISKEKVPVTACNRFINAWLKGKVTPYIYISHKRGITTPEAIRILQGRL